MKWIRILIVETLFSNHTVMEELTLITPTFLFSAVSLILLAYTNRFLAYTSLVRNLKVKYMENKSSVTKAEIENLKKRLKLTRLMQLYGVASLLLCVPLCSSFMLDFKLFQLSFSELPCCFSSFHSLCRCGKSTSRPNPY